MKLSNRDLLVMSKNASATKGEIDREVEKLHDLLFQAESMENFCIANEIIDINRYKIISTPEKIQKLLRRTLKPFQFVNNKN